MRLSSEEKAWAQEYWTATNYLAAAEVYLKDNFLLEQELRPSDIKDALLGHWGTCPGLNLLYTHLNLLVKKTDANVMLVTGPGHGFAAILANMYLEGSLAEYYPEMTHDLAGLGNVIKAFCWPGGFPSHLNPGVPGCIHEGGELGYALGVAFGAAFDNPDLIVACVVGDGEAETGPTAAAWHSTKWLNPETDGAVLPIIHLNGYKISNPTIYGVMSDRELTDLFHGYGYDVRIIGPHHEQVATAMRWAYDKIRHIQDAARNDHAIIKPRWPVLILRSPKGMTGIKELDGKKIEGSYRSHQVPAKDAKVNPESRKALQNWLRSYQPQKTFAEGVPANLLSFVPQGSKRISNNPHAIGGNVLKPLTLLDPKLFEIQLRTRGHILVSNTQTMGKWLTEAIRLNPDNLRIFSPDELASNKFDGVLAATGRAFAWPHGKDDDTLHPNGRVMEILSEHTLQAWLQGYLLTGRHGLFPSYEAFLPIVDSMVSQYLKFIEMSTDYRWRTPVSSLNYVLTSVCWRQDHNGFSHQNPGFINTLLNKAREERLVRIYLPADANMLLTVSDHCLRSTNRVNVIVSDKQPIRQWLTFKEAQDQARTGASTWDFASHENPDVILAAAGDYQTNESLAAIQLLRECAPHLRVRFVNVSELNTLGDQQFYPNGMDEGTFNALFPIDRHVVFSFHGYPGAVKQLLFDRPNNGRFHVYGYIEKGTTTTPFDMLVRNNVSRYQLAIRAIKHAAAVNHDIAPHAKLIIAQLESKVLEHKAYILEHGKDPDDLQAWEWK